MIFKLKLKSCAKIRKIEFRWFSGSNTAFKANIGKVKHHILHLDLVEPVWKMSALFDTQKLISWEGAPKNVPPHAK